MKILMLASEFHPFRGGIATYAAEIARAAVQAGHTVTVVAADYEGEGPSDTFPFRVLRYPGGQHSMRDLPAKIALVQRLAREEPDFDIVHAVDWPFYIPLALSPYRRRARCILSFHGTEVTFIQHWLRALPLAFLRFWNGWAECVANSADTASRLQQAFSPPSVRVVRLGVGPEWLSAQVPRRQARQALGIAEGAFVIASLGRVVPRKGYDLLTRALATLPPDILYHIQWQIIGPFIDAAYAQKLSEANASLACTVMTGLLPWEEVVLRLSAADVFVLPGQRLEGGGVEGFGLVYLEAGALGLPSVATDIGGIADAIDDGESGLLVPEDDHMALAAALLRLHDNPAERKRLSQGARRRAQASSWIAAAQETYDPIPAVARIETLPFPDVSLSKVHILS